MGIADGWQDGVCWIIVAVLLGLGVTSFLGISIPFVTYIAAIALILAGVFGLIDSFYVEPKVFAFIYPIIFILILIMGLNTFYMVPYVGNYVAMVPVGITSYILNGVIALFLIVDIAQSNSY